MMRKTTRCLACAFIVALSLPLTFAATAKPKTANPNAKSRNQKPITASSPAPSNRPRPTLALQVGHSGPVNELVFSPDGSTLATRSEDGTVKLWDHSSAQLRATLKGVSGETEIGRASCRERV